MFKVREYWIINPMRKNILVYVLTENGYDASITIVDATKMTQYGFSSAVDNISSKYDIHHVTRNDLFMDSLPNGGLLNQKNMVLIGVAIFIIIVSALVIYNVFYLLINT